MDEYNALLQEYREAWKQVGDRMLREVEPELAHTIAVLEGKDISIALHPELEMYHNADMAKLLQSGRIARVLLDRHYRVSGTNTPEEKTKLLKEYIQFRSLYERVILVNGTPEEELSSMERMWMEEMDIGESIPVMLRFEEFMKKAQWNESLEDAAYYAIVKN